MKPLPIVAVSSFARPAPEQPDSLRELVKAVCPHVPRRINRLIELGLMGAHRCVTGRPLPEDTAIYMAFTSGCIADSAALVQEVARGQPPMPVTFINVSSNMAGFYIAASLGLHSGNQVVSSNDFAWESALELAMLGTDCGRGLLLGAVEECAWPLAEHRERLGLAPGAAILETSQWLLADRAAAAPIAMLYWIRRFGDDAALKEFLRQPSWPKTTQIRVSDAQTASATERLGLEVQREIPDGHTGAPAALSCTRFIEARGGSLLHLNRGRSGQWCALHLTTA